MSESNKKNESEKAKVIRKRQLPEKVCERRKFFRKKIITGKSSLNSSPNAKSKGYSRILQASQGAQRSARSTEEAPRTHSHQLDPAQVAANGIVPLPDGMGANRFIAVDFDAEEGSSSKRDAIVTDLTHKEILRPDAPVATVG
jgi:hypothetical protein